MLRRSLSLLIASCFICTLLASCTDQAPQSDATSPTDSDISAVMSTTPSLECTDRGQEYINSFIFLGESTTSHLKSRGVLSGGTATTQVWSTKSGTLMLDTSTAECRIVYPETGEELDLSTAMSKKKPKYMLLTFGLNGATANVSKGEEYFKFCYGKLINTLHSASPDTVIILQSCFPIAENMDMSGHSVDVVTLNGYIDILNGWTRELAAERSLGYLNTCEVLKGADGFLIKEYQVGDGYHLTREAYVEILKYIRTHTY